MRRILAIVIFGALVLSISCQKQQPHADTIIGAATASTPTPSLTPSPTPKPDQALRVELIWKNRFDFRTFTIHKQHEGIRSYEVKAQYPQIRKARTPVSARFNWWIRTKVAADVRRFERLERNAEAHDQQKQLTPAPISEGLEIQYTVYYSDHKLISLRLTHIVMALGQTHPIAYYETINYNLGRGRPLSDLDVFRKGYVKVFSSFSRRHLNDTYGKDYATDEWLREGTKPSKGNFPNWNIVPDGILISFEDYQIASHSFGQVELIVPYGELRKVLRRSSVTSGFY